MLKKTIVKRENGNYTVTENILDESRKNIIGQKVYDRVSGVDNQKEERQYEYNAQGELTRERVKTDGNNWKDTRISYQYSTSSSEIATNLQTPLKTSTGTRDMLLKTTTVNNVSNLVNASGTETTSSVSTVEVYDFFGNLGLKQDAKGGVTKYETDKIGRVTKETYPDNTYVSTSYTVGANNNKIETENSAQQTSKYVYDNLGRYKEGYLGGFDGNTFGELKLEEAEYDVLGRLTKRTKTQGFVGNQKQITTYAYDGQNRITQSEVRDGTNALKRKTTYEYNRSNSTDAYMQDTMQTKIGMYNNGEMIYLYTYDNMYGDRTREEVNVTKNGKNETYIATYNYDLNHNLTSYKDFKSNRNPYTTAQYEYDYAGRVVKEYNGLNQSKTTSYDGAGRKVSETDFAGKTVSYTYNNLDQQIQVNAPFDGTNTMESRQVYDFNGNVVKSRVKTGADSYRETYNGYDSMNRLSYSAYNEEDGSKTYVQYGYDSTGNMTAMVNGLSALMENVNTGTVPEGAARTRYEYDFLNNMTKMIAPDGTEKTYEYDMFGNVLEEGFPDGSISYTYSAMNELLSMTGTKRKCFY